MSSSSHDYALYPVSCKFIEEMIEHMGIEELASRGSNRQLMWWVTEWLEENFPDLTENDDLTIAIIDFEYHMGWRKSAKDRRIEERKKRNKKTTQ